MGDTTRFGGGRTMGTGYLSHSEPVGPCVLVLHESFGMTPSFLRVADHFREERFTALVPDLYDGEIAADVEEAKVLAGNLDEERALAVLAEAVEHLRMNWHPRVGVVGFSSGGRLALELAKRAPVDAVVVYYGYGEIDPANWNTPLLVHAAEMDDRAPLHELRGAFDGLDDSDLHVYAAAGHGFANADVTGAFAPNAASLAMERTIEFLTYHLS